MLSPEQVAAYARDGYVKGSHILDDAAVEELRAELLRVISTADDGQAKKPVLLHKMGNPQAPIWQIVNIWQVSAPFARLHCHPTIVEEIAQLTQAKELRLWHDQIQYKPAGIGGVNMWHQDSPYWQTLEPKDAQITAWVALDDVDADNGCMSMVPGSHLWGNTIEFLHTLKQFSDMPKEFRGQAIAVKLCPVKKGQVHYHHSLTWHGSHENKSGRPRRAIALHFMNERTVFNAKGVHVMKPLITVADGAKIEGEGFPVVWR